MKNPLKKTMLTALGALLVLTGCVADNTNEEELFDPNNLPPKVDRVEEEAKEAPVEEEPAEEATVEEEQVEEPDNEPVENIVPDDGGEYALDYLDDLVISDERIGGYERSEFGSGWASVDGCDMRNRILDRDMTNVSKEDNDCIVLSGTLDDPFTGQVINFQRDSTGGGVDIDHVVALSDAWQTGAANLTYEQRRDFSNDPLNLLAVEASANREKSDDSAENWLPVANFQCEFASIQVAVKHKYEFWVSTAEHAALESVLETCPAQEIHTN